MQTNFFVEDSESFLSLKVEYFQWHTPGLVLVMILKTLMQESSATPTTLPVVLNSPSGS